MHKGDTKIKGMELMLRKVYEVLTGSSSRGWDEGIEGRWDCEWTV